MTAITQGQSISNFTHSTNTDFNHINRTRDVSRLVRHVKTRHPEHVSDDLCLPPDYYEDWESEWAPALSNYNNMFSSDEEDDTENSSSYKSSERSHSPHSDSGTYVDGPGSPSASTAVGSPPPTHAYVGGHYPMQYQQFAAPSSQYPSGVSLLG